MVSKSLEELVREIPHLSLIVPSSYTKILKETTGKPMIIRQALGLKHTLENLPIIIRPWKDFRINTKNVRKLKWFSFTI